MLVYQRVTPITIATYGVSHHQLQVMATHRLPSHDPSASGGRHLCPSRAGAADPSGGEVVGSSPASQHPLLARAVLGWTQLQGRAAHGCRELNMSGFVTVCLKVLPLIPHQKGNLKIETKAMMPWPLNCAAGKFPPRCLFVLGEESFALLWSRNSDEC